MSILPQPIKHKSLACYLGMSDNVDLVRPFIKRLVQSRIFDERFKWFRHELVQRCFEDDLDDDEKVSHHERAAKLFESLIVEVQKGEIKVEQESYRITISCAYHFHMAGRKYREKSFTYNKTLAEYATKIGDLDVAERSYKRAIDDAKDMGRAQDEMDCLWDMTTNVYYVWSRYEDALSTINHY
jgi:tetratricopeptide (TPR) repeat protein